MKLNRGECWLLLSCSEILVSNFCRHALNIIIMYLRHSTFNRRAVVFSVLMALHKSFAQPVGFHSSTCEYVYGATQIAKQSKLNEI